MSALFGPTALVVPFENLRMGDVESVGGKNASLGEMIAHLPSGRQCSHRLRHHGARVS
jgi:pyruvate,water dikinase